jgi:cellulase/cellobiase CelA1
MDIGESTEIGYCATRPATPVETPPPPPAGTVTARLTITADWTGGYCASVAVTNNGGGKAAGWKVDVPNVQGTVNGLWNGKYTMEGTTMHLSGPDWNPDLAAGATNSDAGFCANR